MTRDEINEWLINNESILNSKHKIDSIILEQILIVYNELTGEKKKKTTCGRCIYNMIARLKSELIRLSNKTKLIIYRTNFGHLTLNATTKIAYTIYLEKTDSAEDKLEYYKQLEKNNLMNNV